MNGVMALREIPIDLHEFQSDEAQTLAFESIQDCEGETTLHGVWFNDQQRALHVSHGRLLDDIWLLPTVLCLTGLETSLSTEQISPLRQQRTNRSMKDLLRGAIVIGHRVLRLRRQRIVEMAKSSIAVTMNEKADERATQRISVSRWRAQESIIVEQAGGDDVVDGNTGALAERRILEIGTII